MRDKRIRYEATKLFSWEAKASQKAAFDTQFGAFSTTAKGRPDPSPNLVASTFVQDKGRWAWSDSYEPPSMDADGRLRFQGYAESDLADQHIMALVRPSNETGAVSNSVYTLCNRRYVYNFAMDFGTDQTAWDHQRWAVLWQHHPGAYGGTWGVSQNPPLALYYELGRFEMHVRGSTIGKIPTYFEKDVEYDLGGFQLGRHEFSIEVQQDYRGINSLTEVHIDGTKRLSTNQVNSLNLSAIGQGFEANTPTIGFYGGHSNTAPSYPAVLLEYLHIYELDTSTPFGSPSVTW